MSASTSEWCTTSWKHGQFHLIKQDLAWDDTLWNTIHMSSGCSSWRHNYLEASLHLSECHKTSLTVGQHWWTRLNSVNPLFLLKPQGGKVDQGPFCRHVLSLNPAWMSDYINRIVWEEINYPFLTSTAALMKFRNWQVIAWYNGLVLAKSHKRNS